MADEKKEFTWTDYHKKVDALSPRPWLLKALEHTPKKSELHAVDLGAGNGRDSRYLLQNGWEVNAIEPVSSGIEILKSNLTDKELLNLTTVQKSFEDLQSLPKVDLVYAGFSIPFCNRDFFPTLWTLVKASLEEKGSIFAGQFFGPHDEWVARSEKPLLGHSREDLKELFKDFEIIEIQEQDSEGKTADGSIKHWHIFDVIARKL
jgi:Trans-aconitate methyltransferase